MHDVTLYTDGSCLGNPGRGGWAAILTLDGTEYRREISGGCALTTNNRMEILSVIEGLRALKKPCAVTVHSDSQYVCNAIAKGWLRSWASRGWVKANKHPVKNVDLWQELMPLLERHRVTFHWLRGHAGHPENERCDLLARTQASRGDLPPDPGFSASCL